MSSRSRLRIPIPSPIAVASRVYCAAPAAMPAEAANQTLAAVVRFFTSPRATKMVPAAMKPIAWASPWITRSGSESPPSARTTV